MELTAPRKSGKSAWPVGDPVTCDCCGKHYLGHNMAAKRHSKAGRGGGSFARSTRASRLKQVARASAEPQGKYESLVILQNLAKVLVDRIEAACAARNRQVPNPNNNKVLLNPGSVKSSDPSRRDVDQSCEKRTTQKQSGHLGDDYIRGRDGVELDTQSSSISDSRPSSQPNPSGSTTYTTTSEMYNSRPSSRPNWSGSSSTRERTASSHGSMSSRILPLKKVNVALDNCEMPPIRVRDGVRPRKITRSPGLRSLVLPQEKTPKTPPANTKLVLDKGSRSEENQSVHDVWTDVVQNVFDEVFREEEPECRKPSQLSRPSAEWIIQMQSIKYRSWRRERSPPPRRRPAHVDNKYRKIIPSQDSASTTLKERGRGKAPVILPTLAKYHMDKIEWYKKCVAEKQLRDQQECRPTTAPADPYNVLNVYAERCAQRRATPQKSSEHEVENQQPNSRERVSTQSSEGRSIPEHKSHRSQEKPITLTSINERPRSKFEENLLEAKGRITGQKEFLREDQRPRKNLTEGVSKKTRFRDHWPFLDRQIEAFIQAHILQCCIIFKNVPLVFPTMEYQEEIQRMYREHPLST